MKKILGLDLGTTSIGWAYVNEAENEKENSNIIKLGVRVIPLTTDEETDFQKGKSISINADRTLKRGARRNLDRFQLRRKNLIEILKTNGFITNKTILSEENKETHSTYEVRAKAAKEKITKEEFAKVLLMINKKRGYKSSRKAKSDDEGTAIDGMQVAKSLYDNNLTPGQYVYNLLKEGKRYIPDFYRSDLQIEFDKIWEYQKIFYSELLTDELKEKLRDKNKTQTWAICKDPFNIEGIKLKGKANEQKIEKYRLRNIAFSEKIDLEYLAIVLQEINNQKNHSSGYLGAISDRSKHLYFNNQTVGEYLHAQIKENPNTRLKNQVFYRQDYLDEFERIWETQKQFYPEFTDKLKHEIRDVVIFYQRRLKSQKHLISTCEFEKYHKVIPKSSPLFQEFKIWQIINNIEIRHIPTRTIYKNEQIDQEYKNLLFNELNIVEKLSAKEVLKIIVDKPNDYELNFKDELEGNRTNAEFYKAYYEILKLEGEEINQKKLSADDINFKIATKFAELNIEQDILSLNTDLEKNDFDKQPIMQLWHLLYSFEGDNSRTGDEKLVSAICNKFGFKPEHAKVLIKAKLQTDYGNLSSRAIRKILPYLRQGNKYDLACYYAGYNHSSSKTKEELEKRELKDSLELLPKNSLRNPVVEKILNQLVNLVNAIIKDENLGKPDEIRIELARELKKSAKEREDATKYINKATLEHKKIKKELAKLSPFNKGVRITKNDIVKYKLYQELAQLGYKTIYTNKYVSLEKLFSKEFDIEHIIPKALLFDDSFSNKTLAVRDFNRVKSNKTGIEAVIEKYGTDSDGYNRYISNVEKLYNKGVISKAKYNKLLMYEKELPDGFIERDLRNSQYIAKKAKQMLEEVVRNINTTTGSITSRLREDWQLINIMQELNWDKYHKLGLTHFEKSKDGKDIPKITGWTKRNDHRHHAMDALTVAFTRPEHVQYLNNMNARRNEAHEKYHSVYGIEQKHLYRNDKNKLLFNPPMPINDFRIEAMKHLENILVSFKAKNKVVTRNKNKIKIGGKNNYKEQIVLTPRGKLHEETVYGKIEWSRIRLDDKISKKQIELIKDKRLKNLIKERVKTKGSIKKAFGKDSIDKVIYKGNIVSELTINEPVYTKRVEIVKFFTDSQKTKSAKEKVINNIIDIKVRKIIQNRLNEYEGDFKKAFSNLEQNPIWLNKEKGIKIKRVTITGVNNAEALHYKKDHNGKPILNEKGNKQPVDFVSTGNNHHVAIFQDKDGNLHEEVVSFYEAVHRVNAGLPVINKNKEDLEFLFTMKQNEYFIFPSGDFSPEEVDLLNPDNASIISPHLFRIQKISTKNYVFNHHLETEAVNNETLKKKKNLLNITHNFIQTPNNLKRIVKVRINHLGQIVIVGE